MEKIVILDYSSSLVKIMFLPKELSDKSNEKIEE
jgi:hypothetical protein